MTNQPGVQAAEAKDFDELWELLNLANDYSEAKSGDRMWHDMDKARADLKSQLETGNYYVLRGPTGLITASVGLSEQDSVWGAAGQDGQALYFFKLIKNPTTAEPNAAVTLLQFVAAEAQRRHKSVVRCDTVAEPEGIVNYYQRLEFVRAGTFSYDTGRPGVLLEAPVSALIGISQS